MRTCYTLKKKEVLFLSFPASPQGLALLAQSKRVASRVCKAASLQSSPTPAPRQLPASLWNLRALTPNTPPKLPLRQLPASLWNLRALAPNTPPKLPLPPTLASRAPLACRGRRRPRRWRVEPRWPAGEDDGCACGTSARWPRSLPPSLGLDPPPKRRTKRWGGGDGEAATAGRRTKRCLCREGCLCVAFFRCAKLCASQRQSSWAVALPAPEALIAFRHIRRDTYWQPTAGPRKKCADLCPVATCLWGQILRWQCSAYS